MPRRRSVLVLGAIYLVALLLIGLWPTHIDQGLDMVHRPPTTWLIDIFDLSPSTGYRIGEFVANIALFIPLGMLAKAFRPRLSWMHITLIAGLISIAIELTQTIARPDRTGSVFDIIANTTGAAIGACAVAWWLHRRTNA